MLALVAEIFESVLASGESLAQRRRVQPRESGGSGVFIQLGIHDSLLLGVVGYLMIWRAWGPRRHILGGGAATKVHLPPTCNLLAGVVYKIEPRVAEPVAASLDQ